MLYIVATPIGNLKDITIRALEILKSADFILCEDTRKTKILLNHYQINKPLLSYHQHSKLKKFKEILNLLDSGKTLALVSEAGTPGISDPGNELIRFLREEMPNLKIIPIPGPSAAMAAASICGFPMNQFIFLGFLPRKKGRETLLKMIATANYPVIFFESPYRIIRTLLKLQSLNNHLEIFVGRELTKQFESTYYGNINQLIEKIKNDKIKGEFVIIANP